MVLKVYRFNGSTFKFEESLAPEGAVEVVPERAPEVVAVESQAPEVKQVPVVANKARPVRNKRGQ